MSTMSAPDPFLVLSVVTIPPPAPTAFKTTFTTPGTKSAETIAGSREILELSHGLGLFFTFYFSEFWFCMFKKSLTHSL